MRGNAQITGVGKLLNVRFNDIRPMYVLVDILKRAKSGEAILPITIPNFIPGFDITVNKHI